MMSGFDDEAVADVTVVVITVAVIPGRRIGAIAAGGDMGAVGNVVMLDSLASSFAGAAGVGKVIFSGRSASTGTSVGVSATVAASHAVDAVE
ncbi:Hypothetical predicted protein [Octopus vulgaris]|uniref:Uncharacterized protein n=1 Tax=Octopus vulgaris TaxID=6645 RepID=A0AA36BPV6_OCTVU|nr:Hypothetical predicted protein [Octopus vulgaris]